MGSTTPWRSKVQIKEAMDRKKAWGDKPCGHENLEKEYELGMATGDYVCTQCGESGSGSKWNIRPPKPQATESVE